MPWKLPLAILAAALFVAGVWGLLLLYGEADTLTALGMAIIYAAVVGAGGFALSFPMPSAARAALVITIMVSGIGIVWGVAALTGWYEAEKFPKLIPLLVLCFAPAWALLLPPRPTGEQETAIQPDDDPATLPEKHEAIDRISVKKGAEIHIVRTEELLYVLAEGDYVMLYTAGGRFLKEQTMRWFEERLPCHFVRIHRSCIVNVDEIARVELLGKEDYRVRLKNGAVLKASINGYRALKARIGL